MARYNEILIGRWNRFIQKLTGMKGPPPAPTLSSDVTFAHPFFHGAENRYLEAWQRYAGRVVVGAGGAGNVSVVRLRMPVGANVVAVIERLLFIGGASDNPVLYISPNIAQPTLSIASTNAALDPRGQLVSTLDVTGKNNSAAVGAGAATLTTAVSGLNVPADFILTGAMELQILPGGSIDVASAVANQAITVSYLFRERFLEDSERT